MRLLINCLPSSSSSSLSLSRLSSFHSLKKAHVKEATDALLRWASGDARSFISWGFRFGGGGDGVGGIGSILLSFVFHPAPRAVFSWEAGASSPLALALDLCEAKKSDLS